MQNNQTLQSNNNKDNIPSRNTRLKSSKTKGKTNNSKTSSLMTHNIIDLPKTHYQTVSLCELKNLPDNKIFGLYLDFLLKLEDNQMLLEELFQQLKFQEHGNPTQTIKPSIKSFIHQKSFNGQQITSLEDFNNLIKKRISIQVIQSNLSLDSFGSIHYDSDTSFDSDELTLTIDLIMQLFENPSPFIMIQSICLLLKYLWRTKILLTKRNCVKLVLTSTMLAFKLCYDQQVEGIGWYYASLVPLESKEIPRLQAKFIKELEFQTDITKKQYFTVSAHLLAK